LIALGIREHQAAGQTITRIAVSGGIARSDLMLEILAAVLNRPLERLVSSEGPALGAAVMALAGLERHLRRNQGITAPFTVADAVAALVKFRQTVQPRPDWIQAYQRGLAEFEAAIRA
jgi:sugar (pentulose or hexulose) kinase